MSQETPLWKLAQADAATICIENQKNGQKNGLVHQTAQPDFDCAVKCLAQHVHHIRQHTKDDTTPIFTFFHQKQQNTIKNQEITRAVKRATTELKLADQGISPDRVSSHSLRAGGAMALHLADTPSHTIQKMGRWSSDTFLVYIHSQIKCFAHGLAAKMAKPHTFIHLLK